jgi:predicted RecA/RadA family phage recombinase
MTLPLARRIGCDDVTTLNAASASFPGDVVRLWPGMVGIVLGTQNIASGDPASYAVEGKWELPSASGTTAIVGAPAFWDTATSLVVASQPTAGFYIGRFIKAKTSGQTVVSIELNAQHLSGTGLGDVITIRRRCTVAEVNAGVALLPAIPGLRYRMVDCMAIAVGGAAGAVTTVDILGTQSAASVKLAAFAQANLTQSTVLRPGATGTAVLADGASFVSNDANTGITVNKTGSNVTTATHIDISFSFAREAA